jgi:hypothetical protein
MTKARKIETKGNGHGLSALKRHVAARGMKAIDGRTGAARAVRDWQQELLVDLGGEENLSKQRRALVDLATRTWLYLSHVDAWLMMQTTLVNKRKKSILPIVKERQQLVDSLARLLAQLGLDRQSKKVPTLAEYLEAKESSAADDQGKEGH